MQVIENNKWYNVSINEEGDKFYYLNNKLHREKGPAIELANGNKIWYLEGQKLACKSQKEFETHINKIASSQLKYYNVTVETLLPATLIYRVAAESPEKAAEQFNKMAPQSVKYRLNGKRDLKATVYEWGTNLIKFIKQITR